MPDPQQDIQTLAERARAYFQEVKGEIEARRADDGEVIVGLDPVGRAFWVGKTESSILEQRQASGNTNLMYFVKLPAKVVPSKLLYAIQ